MPPVRQSRHRTPEEAENVLTELRIVIDDLYANDFKNGDRREDTKTEFCHLIEGVNVERYGCFGGHILVPAY